MSKSKKKRPPRDLQDRGKNIPEKRPEEAEPKPPKFEIGVKGDEFDRKFTRAARAKTADADGLLRSLSRESRALGFDFINFAVMTLLLAFFALSFAFLAREGDPPRLKLASILNGSYETELSSYYKDSLPFGRALKTAGARLGFCDMPDKTPSEEPDIPDEPEPELPKEPQPENTQPVATTVPPTVTDAPTSAPTSETTKIVKPDTFRMYANATVNIRLSPDPSAMIMGYFDLNQRVEVVEIFDDGWASIWYNNMIAYVSADQLGETRLVTTEATTETATEETEPEITTVPEEAVTDGSETTETGETLPPATTSPIIVDPELSVYMSRQSRLECERRESERLESEQNAATATPDESADDPGATDAEE